MCTLNNHETMYKESASMHEMRHRKLCKDDRAPPKTKLLYFNHQFIYQRSGKEPISCMGLDIEMEIYLLNCAKLMEKNKKSLKSWMITRSLK